MDLHNDEDDPVSSDENSNESASSSSSENVHVREPFDISLPPTHKYLDLDANETHVQWKMEEPGSVINVLIIDVHVVLLPSQILPLHTESAIRTSLFKQSVKDNTAIAVYPSFESNVYNIATLIQICQLREEVNGVTVQAIGRQRCQLISRSSAINGLPYGKAKVLSEEELPIFSMIMCPISVAKMGSQKMRKLSYLTRHSYFAVKYSLPENSVLRLSNWLNKWCSTKKLSTVAGQGLTTFSYWVAANLPVSMENRISLLSEKSTERRLLMECELILMIEDIVCKCCGAPLCKVEDVITVSAEGTSGHYVNPGGYVHDLITVNKLVSGMSRAQTSSEYSWFPGYKWTVQECSECLEHIGWRFSSSTLTPRSFYGLTRSSIKMKEVNVNF